MKIPALGYKVGVQSLGRMSPGAPISAANAQSRALGQVAEIAVAWGEAEETAQVNEALMRSEITAARMGSLIENTSVWDTGTMGPVTDGVNYKRDEVNADGMTVLRTQIPMHELRNQLYDKMIKGINEAAFDTITSKRARAAYMKGFTATMVSGAGRMAKSNLADKKAHMTGSVLRAYQSALNGGDVNRAINVAESGFRAGLLTPEKYDSMLTTVHSDAAEGLAVARMTTAESTESLQRLQMDLLDGNAQYSALSASKVTTLSRSIEAKMKRISAAEQKAIDKDFKENSSALLVTTMVDMGSSGIIPDDQVTLELLASMTQSDRKTFVAYRDTIRTRVVMPKSHAPTLEYLRQRIADLQLFSDVPMDDRVESVAEAIRAATGVNPVTGQRESATLLTATDMSELNVQLQQVPKGVFNDPRLKEAITYGWQTLTGGSEEDFSFGSDAPQVLNAAQFRRDLLSAAREGGPLFNVRRWMDTNFVRYETVALNDARAELTEKRGDVFMLYDTPASKEINQGASIAAIELARSKGDITDDMAMEYTRLLRGIVKGEENIRKRKENR